MHRSGERGPHQPPTQPAPHPIGQPIPAGLSAPHFAVFMLIPCEAAGCVVFEQRSMRNAGKPHVYIDEHQRQPVDELDAWGVCANLVTLCADESAAAHDRFAPTGGGGHAFG